MTTPAGWERYAPTLVFSYGEQYFPCDPFFAGSDIKRNREKYETLTEQQQRPPTSCYYHVIEGENYKVYEYWYYYAYNKYRMDNHEHDLEYALVFVRIDTDSPELLCLNQHTWHNYEPVTGNIPEVLVELGSHGMFVRKKSTDRWRRGGETLKPPPKSSVEDLRLSFLSKEPKNQLDSDGRLIGDDYDVIGRFFAPSVPWIRTKIYHLPESALFRKVQPVLIAPRPVKPTRRMPVAQAAALVPPTPFRSISIPYSAETLEENLRLAMKAGLIKPADYREFLKPIRKRAAIQQRRGQMAVAGRRRVAA